ncbi:MAG TPA: type II secretion system F family protein [Symbiobacteriaceae bacterium]|nr:type II secretion system F family protein [Symbiobacteriaceae bacterium]
MQYFAGLMTFLAVALALAGALHLRTQSRLATRLLADRDPLEQQTTAYRRPGPLENLERSARQAGLDWTRKHFLLFFGGGTLLGSLLLVQGSLAWGLAMAALAWAGPLLVIRQKARTRADAFTTQLPAALQLMANNIRAGGSLHHAIHAVARQMPDPIRTEFWLVQQAIHLQVPVAEALERVRDRIGLPEFGSVVVACKVAAEAGADLDKVFESIARELVEDRQFVKALQSASTEGKASAKVMTAVPFVIMALVSLLNPTYFTRALATSTGQLLIFGAIGVMAVGWVVIRRITDVRNW